MTDNNGETPESVVTPAGQTPPEEKTPETPPVATPPATGPENPDPAEEGRAAVRIRELIRQRKELEEELEATKGKPPASEQPPQPTLEEDPEVLRKAVSRLKELGFVTKDEVQKIQDRQVLDKEHDRLERLYDGSDGRPRYNREDVEKYALATGIYNPEAAYKLRYEKELDDWILKESMKANPAGVPFTETPRPTVGPGGDFITRETLPELMKDRVWYEKNRQKILDMMARGEL